MNVQVVIVTGSRHWTNRSSIWSTLDLLEPDLVVHGNANGADKISHDYAIDRRVAVLAVPADWKKYGRSAGPRRNVVMLDMFVPRNGLFSSHRVPIVVAFPIGESRGTYHCVREASKRNFPVTVYEERDFGL